MIRNFRTYSIAVELYRLLIAVRLPRHLQDQCRRAASSIVLNLAEGSGRSTKADQARFFSMALGSLREVQAILDLVGAESQILELTDILAAHVYKLIRHCKAAAS